MRHLRSSLALLVLLCVSSPAWGGPPNVAITGPTQVIPGSAVFLTCETDSTALEWLVFPTSASGNFVPLTLFQGMTPDGKPILKYAAFFSSPIRGTYTFAAVGVKDNQLGKAVHTLVNGGPSPDPGPQPNPNPQPNPQPDPNPTPPPTPGKRFILVIQESGESTLSRAQTLTALRNYATEKGHVWRFEDKDLVNREGKMPAWFRPYQEAIARAGLVPPCLVVGAFSADGKNVVNLKIVALPDSPEAAVKVVKDHGG